MKTLFPCIAFAFRLPVVFSGLFSGPPDGPPCEIEGVNKVLGSIFSHIDFNHLDSGNQGEGLLA